MAQNETQGSVRGNPAQIPAARTTLAHLHLCCLFQSVLFQRFCSAQHPADPEFLAETQREVAGEGKIEEAVLVRLVKFGKAGPENEMIEQLVHRQKTATAVDQRPHLHEPKLVQTVGPKIERMSIFRDNLCEAIVKGRGRFNELRVFVALHDVHIGSDRFFERQVDHLSRTHRARPAQHHAKPCRYAQVSEQTHCHLHRAPRGSSLALLPRNAVFVVLQRGDRPQQLLLVGGERDEVAVGDDLVHEFGVDSALNIDRLSQLPKAVERIVCIIDALPSLPERQVNLACSSSKSNKKTFLLNAIKPTKIFCGSFSTASAKTSFMPASSDSARQRSTIKYTPVSPTLLSTYSSTC